MKTLQTDTTGIHLPRFASCLTHGRYGAAHDAVEGCPFCLRRDQSLLRYGSNSLDAPIRNEGRGTKVVIGMAAVVAVLLIGFWAIVHQANSRLDAAVSRIERSGR